MATLEDLRQEIARRGLDAPKKQIEFEPESKPVDLFEKYGVNTDRSIDHSKYGAISVEKNNHSASEQHSLLELTGVVGIIIFAIISIFFIYKAGRIIGKSKKEITLFLLFLTYIVFMWSSYDNIKEWLSYSIVIVLLYLILKVIKSIADSLISIKRG